MVKTNNIKGNFVQIPHSFLRDKDLSFEARSLGIYIASLPANWNINWEQVAYEIGLSYAKVRKLVKELINAGELVWEQIRDENGRFCGKSSAKLNYTKEQNLFGEKIDDFSEEIAEKSQEQTRQMPKNNDFYRVYENPHVDFVQHKNKDLKEERDYIYAREKNKNPQNVAELKNSYRLFNRNDLNLNLWQLFENGKKGLKIATNTQREARLNPQGLDEAGGKAWTNFVDYRRSLRQFGGEARARAARKFEEFYAQGIDLVEAVEIAISRGWFCFWDKQGFLITGQKTLAQKQAQLESSKNLAQNPRFNASNAYAKRLKLDWEMILTKHRQERDKKQGA